MGAFLQTTSLVLSQQQPPQSARDTTFQLLSKTIDKYANAPGGTKWHHNPIQEFSVTCAQECGFATYNNFLPARRFKLD